MNRLLSRLLTVTDEDGELRHRFQDEWDGNADANWRWSSHKEGVRDHGAWTQVTWSNWSLGPEVAYYENWAWGARRSERVRWHCFDLGFGLGPFHLGVQIHLAEQ